MRPLHRLSATLLMLCLATAARAYDTTPVRDSEALGFSSSRLERIAAWQQAQVDEGAFSGAVAAIARNGKVAYLRAVGFRDHAKTVPLQPDAIFWIASMTKPITSVAAMMLIEEGKLDLAAPVHQYLPAFKDVMVGVETRDPASGETRLALEPQKRPMIVEDLLRHTSGFVYQDQGDAAVHRLYRESGMYPRFFARGSTLQDFASRLARLPLAHQPGEVWEYGHSVDLLGRVIEIASGQPLDQFLDSRLFKPLGMVDTAFWVPPEKLDRLLDPPVGEQLTDRAIAKPTTLFAGGQGLVSSVPDYLRFCQMLLNGGELDGVRILKPATVRRMTTNALPPGIRFAGAHVANVGPPGGSTFGLGFAIRSEPAWSTVPGSVGSFSWGGAWGAYFWIDPAGQLIAIQLVQVPVGKEQPVRQAFRNLTYGAFLVPDQGVPASAPVAMDQAALAALEGTYAFTSFSSRDKQEPFGGIGIRIEMQNGLLKVLSPIQDAPAAKAGVVADDIVTHVDDVATQGMTLNQALGKLRGPVNTTVRLKIARNGQAVPIELTIVRAGIRLAGADLQVVVNDGKLQIEASGAPVLDFEKGAPITVVPMSSNEFFVDGGNHTRLAFERDAAGKATRLVLNPGPWQIAGRRIK
jgi:CubicO group peptidase (beta-lactamase class C family)